MSEEERKDMDIEPETPPESPTEAPPETPAEAPPADAPTPDAPPAPDAAAAAAAGAAAAPKGKPPKPPKEPKKSAMQTEQKTGLAEQVRIFRARRELRKDLKEKGIKDRKQFNMIAESLGLVGWKASPFLMWLHHALGGLGAAAIIRAIMALGALSLVAMFVASAITEEKGSFTINLTGDMLKAGFMLSNTEDFAEPSSRLFSETMKDVNNITLDDIDPEVDKVDGPHNGKHYIAYTFYIKNTAEEPGTYAWKVNMTSEILNVTKAVWLMVFEDGRQVTYTRQQDNGSPEELFGFEEPLLFSDVAYDAETQYYEKYDNEDKRTEYGIITTPYANEEEGIVAQGLVKDVPPEGMHKYTVVIWVEGWDPECKDDIFGGYAKFEMNFEYVEDESKLPSIFDGVYRTEYDDFAAGKTDDSETTEPEGTDPAEDTTGPQ